MSDKVAESFNMARPFKSPQEEQDVEPWVRRDDYDWMVGDRDTWKTEADNWKQQVQLLTAENCRLVAIRDAARAEVAILRAKRSEAQEERDAALVERDAAEAKCQKLHAENEGLRADLLAHPPQRIDFQQYCSLKADHEQQAAAIEALQEALEESQDKGATLMRGAESDHQIILGLRECLERSDKRLSQAKARQIPPALVGLLGVIRREAAAAEKMIL